MIETGMGQRKFMRFCVAGTLDLGKGFRSSWGCMASSFFFVPSPESRGFGAFFGRVFGFFFSLIFLGGGVMVLHKGLEPWLLWFSARHWVSVPAVIESSRLASDKDSDGDRVCWVEVKFRYEAGGRAYVGERYGLDREKSNVGVEAKREAVRGLKPGAAVRCWVNPKKPQEAVLDREMHSFGLIGLFFPIPFLAVGVTGTVGMLFGPALLRWHDRRRAAILQRLRGEGRIILREEGEGGEEALPVRVIFAREERLKALGGLTFINLFWNGIVAVFVVVAVTDATQGNGWMALGLGVFLIPFVMVGGVMLWQGAKAWRQVFRPNWVAVLEPMPGFEGGETAVSFAPLPAGNRMGSLVKELRLVAFAGRFDENGNPQKEGDLFGRFWRKKNVPSENEPRELQVIEMPADAEEGLCVTAPYDAVPEAPPPGVRGKTASTWGRWWELQAVHADGSVERFDAFG